MPLKVQADLYRGGHVGCEGGGWQSRRGWNTDRAWPLVAHVEQRRQEASYAVKPPPYPEARSLSTFPLSFNLMATVKYLPLSIFIFTTKQVLHSFFCFFFTDSDKQDSIAVNKLWQIHLKYFWDRYFCALPQVSFPFTDNPPVKSL